jgi:heptosyltransferase-2
MRNQALLAPGMNYPTCRPKLYPTPADFNAVSSYEREPLYTISPASLWFTKQYPAEKWVELIARIPSHANICLLGAKSDDALCKSIIAQSGHGGLVNLAGKLTLLQSAALMKKSRMNFTNDSAPMHLASAMNASVTAVFCSTIPGFGFGPLSDNSVVAEIPGDLACRPCGLHGQRSCPQQHFKCAFEIQVESLLKNV